MYYARITAYYPAKDISCIIDSNGKYKQLWQFSAYLGKNFKIRIVSKEQNFEFSNKPDEMRLILRACQTGEPIIDGNRIEVNGRYYFKK